MSAVRVQESVAVAELLGKACAVAGILTIQLDSRYECNK